MSLVILDSESGKAFRCVAYGQPRIDGSYLDVDRVTKFHGESVGIDRHILEEVPSPYILREDVEPVLAAGKHLDQTLARSGALGNNLYGSWQNFAAALENFEPSPPEVQERFWIETTGPDVLLHDRENPEWGVVIAPDTDFASIKDALTEIAAALNANELSGRG